LYNNDSTYRKPNIPLICQDSQFLVNKEKNLKIQVTSIADPAKLVWNDLGVDTVLECTGRFLTTETASLHLNAGARKVLLSAPAKDENIKTVVLGVNNINEFLDEKILSNASCTTNCIAPVLKLLNDSYQVDSCLAMTAHAYAATQVLQDAPGKSPRDSRAAAINMIPSSTGAAKAVSLVIPQLANKINLSSLRVPIITGSMIYMNLSLEKNPEIQEIHDLLKFHSQNYLSEIIEFSTQELVSSDIIGNSRSSIIDSLLTEKLDKNLKMILWYDNEWGYANRLADLASKI